MKILILILLLTISACGVKRGLELPEGVEEKEEKTNKELEQE